MIVRVSDLSFLLPEMQTFYISHCIGHQRNKKNVELKGFPVQSQHSYTEYIHITLCVHVLGNIEQFEKSFMLLVSPTSPLSPNFTVGKH